MSTKSKTSTGNFFENFRIGQEIRHATPRTLTEADAAVNIGLYGSRFAINSSDVFARSLGLPRAPLDDLLVFHVVIGKTVPDISLNAVANLGYAEFAKIPTASAASFGFAPRAPISTARWCSTMCAG